MDDKNRSLVLIKRESINMIIETTSQLTPHHEWSSNILGRKILNDRTDVLCLVDHLKGKQTMCLFGMK